MKKIAKEIIFFALFILLISNIIGYFRSYKDIKNADKILPLTQKTTVVYFWGSWFPICKRVSPAINQISKQYSVISVAVNSGNDSKIKKYLKENNLTFNVINDQNAKLANYFKVSVFPTILIFKNKKLIYSDSGYTSYIMLKIKLLVISI